MMYNFALMSWFGAVGLNSHLVIIIRGNFPEEHDVKYISKDVLNNNWTWWKRLTIP